MLRWSKKERCQVERTDIDVFVEDVIAVCLKHGLSIGHEDYHGSFEIEEYTESNADWLRKATDAT